MGYFANGIEASAYQERYCYNCQNWTIRENEDEEGCPIIDYHFIYNYDLCSDQNSFLDKLIPRKDGWNERCVMYLPKY